MKKCRFVDKYVTRVYGTHTVSAWLTKNNGKTVFDMVTMSDIAYTVAVIENGHKKWDESINRSGGECKELPKMPKFTKKGGVRREYNSTGWNQEGIDFYNKVWEGWKKLSGENKFNVWKQVEDKWFVYIEEKGQWENQGRRKKRYKSNLDEEDLDPPMPNLPGVAADMVFVGDEDYQPDCPWKISGIEQEIDEALMEHWGETSDFYIEGSLGLRNRVSFEGNKDDG
jgi:hypothetical protein